MHTIVSAARAVDSSSRLGALDCLEFGGPEAMDGGERE